MRNFRVYYMRPEFFSFGIMGLDWLAQHNKVPLPGALDRTHVHLRTVEARDMEHVFAGQQAERWSPNGEARRLIESKGLQHTSMSVGDIVVDDLTDVAYICDTFGFSPLHQPKP